MCIRDSIPSNPPHQPLLLEGGVENVADLLKELVPLKMAVAVVDLLKVDVYKRQAPGCPRRTGAWF